MSELSPQIATLESFKSIQKLKTAMLQRDLSQNTYTNYLWAIKDFIQKTGFTNPDEVVVFVDGQKDKALSLIKQYIDAYRPKRFNGEWKKPRRSLKTYMAGIKFFLRCNDTILYAEDVKDLMPRAKRQYQPKPCSREVLDKLVNNLSLRGKVVVCLAAGSGLRAGTILRLQMRDIVFNDPDSQKGELLMKIPYTIIEENEVIKKMKGSSSDDTRIHHTFITPECREYLEDYIAYRERQGETITPESPVVTHQKQYNRWKPGDFLSYYSLWKEIGGTLLKLGLRKKGERSIHPHSFRAFFRTSLAISGCDDSTAERLMAHEGGYLESSYFAPQIKILRDAFVSALPFVEIRGPNVKPEQLQKQAQIIARQEEEIRKLKSAMDEMGIKAQNMMYISDVLMQLYRVQYGNKVDTWLKEMEAMPEEERNKLISRLLKRDQK